MSPLIPFDDTGVMDSDYTPQERAFWMGWQLAHGAEMSARDIAERLGMTERGARQMMSRGERVLPICLDGGRWRKFS